MASWIYDEAKIPKECQEEERCGGCLCGCQVEEVLLGVVDLSCLACVFVGESLDVTDEVALTVGGTSSRVESLEELSGHGEEAFKECLGEDGGCLLDGILDDLEVALSGFVGL